MANEYLKRTPTSTGNRKVWTWAGWVKRNQISSTQTRDIQSKINELEKQKEAAEKNNNQICRHHIPVTFYHLLLLEACLTSEKQRYQKKTKKCSSFVVFFTGL